MKSLKDYIDQINQGTAKATLIGIGPMSESVIEASLELAKQKNFPLMYIASRNQVDSDALGGGYANNWNQKRFAADIQRIANSVAFGGDYFICRDHGGPWQRDLERKCCLPVEEAMAIAKESYTADIEAGFDLLHIDPTKIPGHDVAPVEQVIRLTVELIEFCERQREWLGGRALAYEVGTEETNGGLTKDSELEDFILALFSKLEKRNLPKPVFVVGQTGTLVRMTKNVGTFSLSQAEALSRLTKKYGLGLKEHNCDYLQVEDLYLHPAAGVTASNVAPEFGFVETCSLLALCRAEQKLYEQGNLSKKSELYQKLVQESINCRRWQKWLITPVKEDEIVNDRKLREEIVQLAGHYTFNNTDVKEERRKLYENLSSVGLDAHRFVIEAVKACMDKYVTAFQLSNAFKF